MQIILTENVTNLGFVGDIVKVKDGYARNFLIPRKLAMPISKGSIKQVEHQKKVIEVKKSKKKAEASQLKTRIEAVIVTLSHAAEGDRLYGSVSTAEIQEQLKKLGFDLDRKLIRIDTAIKTLGEHTVEVKLHQDVAAQLRVVVEKKDLQS